MPHARPTQYLGAGRRRPVARRLYGRFLRPRAGPLPIALGAQPRDLHRNYPRPFRLQPPAR